MALTPTQQTAILNLINQEGGVQPFFQDVVALVTGNDFQNTLSQLGTGVAVSIPDFSVFAAQIPTSFINNPNAVRNIVAAITTKVGNQDATVGPLLIMLYLVVKAQS